MRREVMWKERKRERETERGDRERERHTKRVGLPKLPSFSSLCRSSSSRSTGVPG
jgi:hypothetical protein